MPLPHSTDVWIIPLDTGDPARDEARVPELGAYERERLRRLGDSDTHGAGREGRGQRSRRRYLAAHLAARDIVAGYLDCAPADLTHVRNALRGKPGYVLGWCPGPAVSLSRSGDLALLAVRAADSVVGVDVERVRPGIDWLRVLGRPYPDPADAFRAWTRLEATVKASGLGLAAGVGSDLTRWSATDVTLPQPYEGYAAAVATDRAEATAAPVRIRPHSEHMQHEFRRTVTLP
ncbi:4'-phosphopantetheinyl transferase family protein [Streptomyces scopuliridis]|uniref:4'-phosphopantetheinyl transferase family protein n=1 Tax=Streptomyces scopuliridis TaxID=452529 RepID=UPI00367CD9DD